MEEPGPAVPRWSVVELLLVVFLVQFTPPILIMALEPLLDQRQVAARSSARSYRYPIRHQSVQVQRRERFRVDCQTGLRKNPPSRLA